MGVRCLRAVEFGGEYLTIDPGGVGQIGDVSVQHQDGPTKAITILDDKKRRILAMVFHVTFRLVLDGLAGRFRQIHRPEPGIGSISDGVAFQAGHGGYARLSADPSFDHTLKGFQRMKSIDIES